MGSAASVGDDEEGGGGGGPLEVYKLVEETC
jgi:hypothetical protein